MRIRWSCFAGTTTLRDETCFENVRQITTPAVSMQVVKDSEDLRFDNRSFGYRRTKISDAECWVSQVEWFAWIERRTRKVRLRARLGLGFDIAVSTEC